MSRDRGYDTVVVFAGIAAASIGAVYWAMRLGFANPLSSVAKAVLLAWFILSFPVATRWVLSLRFADKQLDSWTISYAFLSLLGLALSAFLGRIVPLTGVNPFAVLAVTGVVGFAAIFTRWVANHSVWRSLGIVGMSAMFGGWAAGVVWGRIYKNPLFMENLILDGRVHHDTLHLASFANMLRTYHVASTGIDGIPYISYHWGTQWLFAQWSNLIDARPIEFYQLGFPVTMIPFFFASVLALAVGLRESRPDGSSDVFRADLRVWLLFFAACIGVIPLASLDAMGVWTSNYLISESYTVAVPAALMVAATATEFWRGDSRDMRSRAAGRESAQEWLFYVAFIPIAIVALGYLKISLMFLALPVALYLFVRLRLWSQLPAVISVCLLIAGCYLAYGRVSLPEHREGLARFDFMKTYVPFLWWPFFFLVHLAWSWLYIAFRLKQQRVDTIAQLVTSFNQRAIIDVEVVLLVAILGIAPGLLIHIDGGSAYYFSDVQRWLALGLMLSFGTEFLRFLGFRGRSEPEDRARCWRQLRTGTVLKWFITAPLLITIAINATIWPVRMVRANGETRRGLYSLVVAGAIPAGVHAWASLRDRGLISRALAISPNYAVTTGLASLASLDDAERRKTALFIPQSEAQYWTALSRPGACTYQSFIAPAISGIAMIDGMPPYGCPLSRYYGLGAFTPRVRPQSVEDTQPASLCGRATRWGMSQVIVVRFNALRQMQRSLITCQGIR